MSNNTTKRILICEDDELTSKILQRILEGYGEVSIAGNGKEGWEAIQASCAEDKRFDLCCLDIKMPLMDGYALLEQIRSEESDHGIPTLERLRVLMITSISDTGGFLAAARHGLDGYLLKPINPQALKTALWDLGIEPKTMK